MNRIKVIFFGLVFVLLNITSYSQPSTGIPTNFPTTVVLEVTELKYGIGAVPLMSIFFGITSVLVILMYWVSKENNYRMARRYC
jgi:hypothetical protein